MERSRAIGDRLLGLACSGLNSGEDIKARDKEGTRARGSEAVRGSEGNRSWPGQRIRGAG